MGTTLQRRVARLEDASEAGGDDGCPRCSGVLVLVSNVITGGVHSATWNGAEMSEEEVHERDTETKCPKCGRKIDPNEATQIKVGGTWGSRL